MFSVRQFYFSDVRPLIKVSFTIRILIPGFNPIVQVQCEITPEKKYGSIGRAQGAQFPNFW